MSFFLEDRVRESATTTGTSDFSLAGHVRTFFTFASVFADGDTFDYCIEHLTLDEVEIGLGTFHAPNTLERTTVYRSSNANAHVNFSAGTKHCFVGVRKGKFDGTVALAGEDVLLATGGTLNWDSGDVVLSHSANVLSIGTADFHCRDLLASEAVGVSLNGSNSVTLGAYFSLSNTAVNRIWVEQLNASNGVDHWYFNGTAWAKLATVDTSGNPTFGDGAAATLTLTLANSGTDVSLASTNGLLTVTGAFSTSGDCTLATAGTNGTAIIGKGTNSKAILGTWPYLTTNYAFFGNNALDHTQVGNYCLIQQSDGSSYLNAASGKTISLRNNNSDVSIVSATGLSIGTGSAPTRKLEVQDSQSADHIASIYNTQGGTGANGLIIAFGSDSSSGAAAITFKRHDGTVIGTITEATTTTTAYNTSSDERLKVDIIPSTRGLDVLRRVRVRDFRFKNDPQHVVLQGFVAQELREVYPEAVHVGGDDAVTKPWMVDHGRMTPLLVMALQELESEHKRLSDRFEELAASIRQLLGKLA